MATTTESDLEDELAVQRVILASLEGVSFRGIENERSEAYERIATLQQRLKEIRGTAHASSSGFQQNGGESQISFPTHSRPIRRER